jgi:hypothetical protein
MKTILLFAILALSINVFAQSKRPVQFPKHSSTNAIENSQSRARNAGLITQSLYSGATTEQSIFHYSVSDMAAIQILDSLYTWTWDVNSNGWKLDSRMINVVYDANNNMINSTDQNWTGTAWVNSEQSTYTYDAHHNNTSELLKVWSNNAWVNDMMNIWTYDANGNETSTSTKSWDGSTWVNENQTLYTYNANNNPTSMIYQSWGGMDWENSEKITYTYDANYNLTLILYQDWDGSAWENSMRETNTYNASNKKITSLMQFWMEVEWFDQQKITYTYTNNNLTGEITEVWNFSEWENFSKAEYSYDANNNMISQIEQEWDESEWVNSQKAYYAYDQNQNQTNTMVYAWDGSTWLNYYQMNYGYDANNFAKFLVWKKWDTEGTSIAFGDSLYIYYHTVITGIPGPKESSLTLYPNPCKGKLTISSSKPFSSIEIYNLAGNRIYSDYTVRQQTSNEIDLSGYAKGVYVMKVYYGTKFISKKIIVQ